MKCCKFLKFVHFTIGVFLCLLPATFSYAQVLTPDLPGDQNLSIAEEQFEQGNFELAARAADQYLISQSNKQGIVRSEGISKARFFSTVAKLKLDIPGIEDSALRLMNANPDPNYRQRLSYAVAQYYFRHNQFSEAVNQYEKAGIANLSNNEIADKKFELAYCYFNSKQFDKAEPLFASIKELQEGKYYAAGNYYYGLLAYNDNNYNAALQSFERIKDKPEYNAVVPYYIAEIHYFTGDKKKALEYARMLIDKKDKSYYDNELRLLTAQCLFEEQNFTEALPLFEYYYEHTEKIRKEDLYEMAYCYYMADTWDKAIEKFKLLSDTRDSLGQTAMYLLGDCYLKTGDKQNARNAFSICADMAFNPGQKEASLMLNAKLCYEVGYNDEAAGQLNDLLRSFPESQYKDEATTMLSELLLKTNKYAEALKGLGAVGNRDEKYMQLYQKVTYGYGMQLLDEGNLTAADSLLSLSLKSPVNGAFEAAAWFWRGDIAYRMNRFSETIAYTDNYINKGNETATRYISPFASYQHAYLNMGYAAIEIDSFAQAQNYFSKAQQIKQGDTATARLALLREADAAFMLKDYGYSLSLYEKIINSGTGDADYARYQKSIVLGLQGNNKDKIALLQAMMNKTPPSRFAIKARYELALTYIGSDQYEAAISLLQQMVQSAENAEMAPKAWMKIGFSYRQLNNTSKAIDAYKHVVTQFPASEERPAALDALKGLYIETNQPATYTKLLRDNNLPSADSAIFDSTYYSAAESQFAEGNWSKAKDAFSIYIAQFKNGSFTAKAHFYRAECYWQLRDSKNALTDYEAVLQNPWGSFSEHSARRAAIITYQNADYKAATSHYLKLRKVALSRDNILFAYTGLMKTSFVTSHYTEAVSFADTLLFFNDLADNLKKDAQLFKAKSLQELKKPDEAFVIYRQLEASKDGELSAEARYHIAEIYLGKNKLKEAETAANNAIRKSAGYDYWIVKSYILLADVLAKQKDYFNAKATLRSIVKQSNIAELKQEAAKKLEKLKQLEKQQSKLSQE